MHRFIIAAWVMAGTCSIAFHADAAANPSSVFCEKQGGRGEIVKDKDGNELELCHLPDGRTVEAWAYFRQNDAERSTDGAGNPADTYCEEQGGTLEAVTDATNGELSLCRLPDGTVEEAWSLFRRK